MSMLETAKKLIRNQLSADLHEKLRLLREEQPALSHEQAWAALEAREPALFAYAARVEADQWETKQPGYRFIDDKKFTPAQPFKPSLADFLPSKVAARELDYDLKRDAVLVEADHEEELHRKTQKLIDRTDGPLHRDIARHLVRDANPSIDDRLQQDEDLAAAQQTIKRRIKEMQLADRSKSFRQCWESLQRSNPELFEPLPEA